MKRRVFLILLAAVLCMAAYAAADSEGLSFAQTCWTKLSREVTLYYEIDGQLNNVGSLGAGTYVREVGGGDYDGKICIMFSDFGNYGYIDSSDASAIVSCVQSVTLPNGSVVQVPEAAARNKAALNAYLDAEYGISLSGDSYTDETGATQTYDLTDEELAALEGEAKYLSATAKAARKNGFSTPTVYRDDDGTETSVQIVSLGLARSTVRMNGEERLVETWRLSWETEAPEDKVLAVITPKDSPNVRLRTAKSEKATIMDRVETARVLQVIRTDKNWTLVDTNDDLLPRGYISTSVLTFYPNTKLDYRSAIITVNGSTRAKGEENRVRIREKGSGKSREVTKFDLGEQLTVIPNEESGEWLEVDVNGFHGYIQSKFVTYTGEDSGSAESAESAEPAESAGSEEPAEAARTADASRTAETAETEEIEEVRGTQLIP